MTILGRSEELVSRCVECDLAEPESLSSLGGSAPGVVDGILSTMVMMKVVMQPWMQMCDLLNQSGVLPIVMVQTTENDKLAHGEQEVL